MMPAPQVWRDLDRHSRAQALSRPAVRQDGDVAAQTAAIIARVRQGGDAAVEALGLELDGIELDALRVSETVMAKAERSLSRQQVAAIQTAIDNVERFHAAQQREPLRVETAPGVVCERVVRPIDSVGLYVPAGTAPLPSAAIMLGVPARLAGCRQRILCSPPMANGQPHPAVLVAAMRSGVQEVFCIGGAQAIAAMAYGTDTVPKVDKLFGPGNAWVTAAKAQVSAVAGGAAIDLPAGPSEVLVIADAQADAEFVAADLLSQAEHGPDSQVILVTPSAQIAGDVRAAVLRQLQTLSRKGIAEVSLRQSRTLIAADLREAVEISNRYAPEHLIIQTRDPRALLGDVCTAGSVFLGCWSPESVGDYCSGTNHVLPTYGHARAYSGLGLEHFQRTMTVQELTRDGLAVLADTVAELAGVEGLDAHAAAVQCRLGAAAT